MVFDVTFERDRVRMRGGFDEPVYLPAGHADLIDPGVAEVRYTHDYVASALHEAAHFCVAGARRRGFVDYGYEYIPPPRAAAAKARFFALEAKAQALESIFAAVVGIPFRPSLDDLTATSTDLRTFRGSIAIARDRLEVRGLTRSASRFRSMLAALSERPIDALPPSPSAQASSGGARVDGTRVFANG